jgi:hypothetical protein
MSEFVEQLESRQLMSTSYPAAATYNGFSVPKGGASQAAYLADLGVAKKNGDRATAALDVTIANNSVVTGTLDLQGNTYALSGSIVGVYVSVSLDLNGIGEGTFAGKLKSLNKTLSGPLTLSLGGSGTQGGTVTTAAMTLTNDNVKPKGGGGKNSQNVAVVPGYNPVQTPPAITNGSTNNSIGDQTGVSGGNNSVIDNGGDGSVLG